jgi:hypothetical protein
MAHNAGGYDNPYQSVVWKLAVTLNFQGGGDAIPTASKPINTTVGIYQLQATHNHSASFFFLLKAFDV